MARILLVDGDENFSELARLSFEEKFGAEVTCSSNGNMAIEILKKKDNFNLIISEYEMSEGNGRILLDFVISRNLKMPFLFFTANSKLEIPYRVTGFVGVFNKYQFDQLCSSIELLLKR